jgi:ABC-2 type transport system ATP-binding protein
VSHVSVRVEDLTKHYKKGLKEKIIALEGLNLEIRKGEIFGFVGPNGAGKSTTIKIIMNLLFPTRGRVEILGKDSRLPQAREHLGYLPENPSFYDHLTGEEFLYFAGRLVGMKGMDMKGRIHEFLELVGLEQAGKMVIRKYSKGMAQRLGIAQALVGTPQIIIMDEPMSGLDPLGRGEVSQLILNLKNAGKTVFFSSHILHDVETICDRVGILVKGHLTYLGSPSRILDTPSWILKLEGDHRNTLQERGFQDVTLIGHVTQTEIPENGLWDTINAVEDLGLPLYALERKKLTLEEIFVKEVQGEPEG